MRCPGELERVTRSRRLLLLGRNVTGRRFRIETRAKRVTIRADGRAIGTEQRRRGSRLQLRFSKGAAACKNTPIDTGALCRRERVRLRDDSASLTLSFCAQIVGRQSDARGVQKEREIVDGTHRSRSDDHGRAGEGADHAGNEPRGRSAHRSPAAGEARPRRPAGLVPEPAAQGRLQQIHRRRRARLT